MKITVYYTQQVESSSNQEDVKRANKVISDAAFNFQNVYLLGIDNSYSDQKVEIELQYNNKNEIFWGFRTNVSEKIKEMIRQKLKSKTNIEFK